MRSNGGGALGSRGSRARSKGLVLQGIDSQPTEQRWMLFVVGGAGGRSSRCITSLRDACVLEPARAGKRPLAAVPRRWEHNSDTAKKGTAHL